MRERKIQIKNEIKKGFVKDGKVNIFFLKIILIFLILIGVIISKCKPRD
jgi:hypothetical protein